MAKNSNLKNRLKKQQKKMYIGQNLVSFVQMLLILLFVCWFHLLKVENLNLAFTLK